jgi:hypothetical protein
VSTGFDVDGSVAAGGADEFLDSPAGLGLDVVTDGHRGENDRQVRLDRFAGAVIDRLCRGLDYADGRGIGADQQRGIGCGVGIVFGSGFFFS